MTTYTLIAVPSELVPPVTELIESWGRTDSPAVEGDAPTPDISGSEEGLFGHWTKAKIEDGYTTAKPDMRRIFELLASAPGRPFGMDDLEDELGIPYDNLNGLLGGFSKVNVGKYGSTQFPWSAAKGDDGRVKHTMTAPVAEVVVGIAGRTA
jgi:hypothetical protein